MDNEIDKLKRNDWEFERPFEGFHCTGEGFVPVHFYLWLDFLDESEAAEFE